MLLPGERTRAIDLRQSGRFPMLIIVCFEEKQTGKAKFVIHGLQSPSGAKAPIKASGENYPFILNPCGSPQPQPANAAAGPNSNKH